MSLTTCFNEVLSELLQNSKQAISAEELIQCIDLTLLDENAASESLEQLKIKAEKNQVAALCVHIKHLTSVYSKTPLATVINFPNGRQELQKSLDDIALAQQFGALEIDYVLPYETYLAGNTKLALASCQAVSKLCKDRDLKLKIILETGVFHDMELIYQVSKDLITIGCDLIKTSTGKIPQGASLSAVFAILGAIKDTGSSCGIKVSGGVKTTEQAFNYAKLAELMINRKISAQWFRIGASSLLDELLKVSI